MSFLFPLGVLLRPPKVVLEANLTFLVSLHFLIYLGSWFKLPICKIWQLENCPFSKWEVFFQGQILLQIEIKSCSNGVCCSWGISFRWHFWHILYLVSNNLIMKNKVLSYPKLNSGKSSIAADYLHFPSYENTNILFFSLLF